jgi:hypothetical protein
VPTHRYASYRRRGLAALARHDADAPRAHLDVEVVVDAAPDQPVEGGLGLLGPGDVRGLDTGEIIGRSPAPGSEDAEANRFAAIRFATPELPWLFSTGAGAERGVVPWLALVVVPAAAAELRTPAASPSPVLHLPADAGRHLPDPAQLWAWATVREVVDSDGAVQDVVSQLVCPRLLTPETDHLAALVPVYEAGRRQGLGLRPAEDGDAGGGAGGYAWTVAGADGTGGTGALDLPVYDHWSFRTAAKGDFASLARLLTPDALPADAGRRDAEVVGTAPDALTGRAVEIRSPLAAPDLPAPAEAAAALRTALQADPGEFPPPRLGGGHHQPPEPPEAGWRRAVNLTPTYRAAAGIGAEVVQGLEEDLVRAARDQAGDLDGVNGLLRRGQLSREVGHVLHDRLARIAQADPATFLQVTAPVHRRVLLDGATPAGTLGGSRLTGLGSVGWTRGSRRLGGRAATASALTTLAQTGPATHDPDPPPGCETAPLPPAPSDRLRDIPDPDASQRQWPLDDPPKVPPREPVRPGDPAALRDSAGAVADRALEDPSRPASATPPAPLDTAGLAADLLTRLDPETTVPARLDARLAVPEALRDGRDRLGPVRTAPEIVRPLALELGRVSEDLLLSGLSGLGPDRLTAAVPDDAVAAATMLGANEQLLRILRWRRLPLPPRSTPLRRFWPRPGEHPDTRPIASWGQGEELAAQLAGDVELVVLVRGQLLRRYPETVVALVAARLDADGPHPDASRGRKVPLFRADLPPDVTVLGFDLDPATARGQGSPADPGWFLLLQEPARTPGYGLAEAGEGHTPRPTGATDPLVGLSWLDVGVTRQDPRPFVDVTGRLAGVTDTDGLTWGDSAAQQANITLQRTTRVYAHLTQLLGE